MAIGEDIEILSKVALLQGFDTEQLRLLAFGAQKRTLRAGDELYRQGTPTDGGFVVISGKIDLVNTIDGNEIVLESCGPGTTIGELALITKTTRISYAIAREDTELIRLSRTIFLRVLEEFPELAAQLHQQISDTVTDMVEKMDVIRARLEQQQA